ncbi:helix-turn-helix domain-containing protein [Mucilaginibacter daejeonensis]|uniref:helix-turn-helix domain-containing protein n=1 Tax=Mucilaginibacter daejeonensis TaxID=398049 RepID=UPI001D1713AC|nr:helix-turn-helix transcriptional regulator [Mucilaginibacter daejeonensis]UEG53384.1 helix-turn-helix domain-containing protein [Mucilaginibacter daejeonensis]
MDSSKVIAIIRKKKGLSQTDFAKLVGLTQASLSHIESGKKQPHRSTISKICEALGMPETWFDLLTTDPNKLNGIAKERYQLVGDDIKQLILDSIQ